MCLGLLRRRVFSLVMAVAILVVGAPVLPASAAMDCDQMSMAMDMKSAPSDPQKMPIKPTLPCNDGLACLGAAGCAAPALIGLSVVSLPGMASNDPNWTSQLGDPGIAHKPALPPPITSV